MAHNEVVSASWFMLMNLLSYIIASHLYINTLLFGWGPWLSEQGRRKKETSSQQKCYQSKSGTRRSLHPKQSVSTLRWFPVKGRCMTAIEYWPKFRMSTRCICPSANHIRITVQNDRWTTWLVTKLLLLIIVIIIIIIIVIIGRVHFFSHPYNRPLAF